jgi:hypothetical protein
MSMTTRAAQAVPKTSSSKIRRSAARGLYKSGTRGHSSMSRE